MPFDFIFQIAILIMSVVVHEVSHGFAAYKLGDPTAKYEGRLSLNPLKHLDPFGSVILPILLAISQAGFIIGWAKPVPVNTYNLRNQRWGEAIVAAAGPLSNIIIAIIFGLAIRFALGGGMIIGSSAVLEVTALIVFINLLLAVFNLVPIPPLDGSKILFAFLPERVRRYREIFENYGFFIVLIFIFFFWGVISPIVTGLFVLITGLYI
ncbi:MAG: site-2 protease family protein [Patescibacteria group bacterium]